MNLSSFQKTAKVGTLILFLVLALIATMLLGQGVARQYFARASACPAESAAAAQVTANSAVIMWDTTEVTQGRVEYGTTRTALTGTAPEAASGKAHNVPLTLLTPSTKYYYLVTIGDTKCDSTGQPCTGNCQPWEFTTQTSVQTNPTPTVFIPTPSINTPTAAISQVVVSPTGSGGLSTFCQAVKSKIGANSRDPNWSKDKQYDLDNNGIVNGLDGIKCEKSGK